MESLFSGIVHETIAPGKFAIIEHLQKVHETVAVLRGMIPKLLVACASWVPGVATHNFLLRKINAAIHRLENIGSDLREIG